jgi:hypothetical protein
MRPALPWSSPATAISAIDDDERGAPASVAEGNMHTIKVIGIGFALLGILLFLAPRLAISAGRPVPFAVRLFLPLWFAGALINLWVGVIHAGYTVMQEAPIFLVVFGVPALASLLVLWLTSRISR